MSSVEAVVENVPFKVLASEDVPTGKVDYQSRRVIVPVGCLAMMLKIPLLDLTQIPPDFVLNLSAQLSFDGGATWPYFCGGCGIDSVKKEDPAAAFDISKAQDFSKHQMGFFVALPAPNAKDRTIRITTEANYTFKTDLEITVFK